MKLLIYFTNILLTKQDCAESFTSITTLNLFRKSMFMNNFIAFHVAEALTWRFWFWIGGEIVDEQQTCGPCDLPWKKIRLCSHFDILTFAWVAMFICRNINIIFKLKILSHHVCINIVLMHWLFDEIIMLQSRGLECD